MALKVKSYIIDNVNTADATIETNINVTSDIFSISVVPISNVKSRVIIMYKAS